MIGETKIFIGKTLKVNDVVTLKHDKRDGVKNINISMTSFMDDLLN